MSLVQQFEDQALACRHLGSPLYAAVLTEVAADIAAGGPCATALRGYHDAGREGALPLRFLAGVHALVLSGDAPDLAVYYPSSRNPGEAAAADDGAWPAFRAVVADRSEWIRDWLTRPPQTNEVGRAVPLLAGLLAAVDTTPFPVRLFELGASAGLNLRADRFRWSAADIAWGPADSPVVIDDAWFGPVPGWLREAVRRHPEIEVVERLGCDPAPLNPLAPQDRLALRAYLWPDQIARAARLDGALRVAERVPAQVVEMGAAKFLTELSPQPGTLTVVWHSVMRPYVSDVEWQAVEAELARLAADSSNRAPFAYFGFEGQGNADDRNGFRLTARLAAHPATVLARAVPHGVPTFAPADPR